MGVVTTVLEKSHVVKYFLFKRVQVNYKLSSEFPWLFHKKCHKTIVSGLFILWGLKESKMKMALSHCFQGWRRDISFGDPPLVKPVAANIKFSGDRSREDQRRENNFCLLSCVSEGCSLKRKKDSSKILDYWSGVARWFISWMNSLEAEAQIQGWLWLWKTILIVMYLSF